MIIRAFRPADAGPTLRLFRETIHTAERPEEVPRRLKAWLSESVDPLGWELRMDEPITFVAEDHGTVVGFAHLDEDGHILFIYTDRTRQGEEIGDRLMEAMESAAGALGLYRITISSYFAESLPLRRRGFVRHAGYESGDEEGLMEKDLR